MLRRKSGKEKKKYVIYVFKKNQRNIYISNKSNTNKMVRNY